MTGSLPFDHLLAYRDQETARWAALFEKHPQALAVACDIASTKDVAGLVYHIFAVERLHTERLLEVPTTPIEMGRPPEFDNWAALSGLQNDARAKIAQFHAKASDAELDKVMTIQTRSAGAVTMSKRKLFGHLLIHGARHWAQLAPLLRQAGFKQDWLHDFLFTEAVK
jgi:uncharacterized damage-inducible protein DinB